SPTGPGSITGWGGSPGAVRSPGDATTGASFAPPTRRGSWCCRSRRRWISTASSRSSARRPASGEPAVASRRPGTIRSTASQGVGVGVKGVSHVAVGVSDMDRALVFYRDIVGLRVTLDTVEGGTGDGLLGANRRRAVYLRAADGPDAFFI